MNLRINIVNKSKSKGYILYNSIRVKFKNKQAAQLSELATQALCCNSSSGVRQVLQ